jgi:hypothetical protein
MLSSGIFDFAIGLVFTFLAVSLAVGAATEALASILKWRSHTLRKGVMDLLNDTNFNELAAEIYRHGLVNPRGNGMAASRCTKNPSYIEPGHFAAALLDILKGLNGGTGQPLPTQAGQGPVQWLKTAVDTHRYPLPADQEHDPWQHHRAGPRRGRKDPSGAFVLVG